MAEVSIEQALSVLEAEKANLFPGQRKRLAELSEAHEDVRESVTDTLEPKEKREITPEQAGILIDSLRQRYDREVTDVDKTIHFVDVEKSLRAAPEKLYALHKLEETGGEPQVIGIDGDEFVFEDRCDESPAGRRNLTYEQALAQAEAFGVDMQSPDDYEAMKRSKFKKGLSDYYDMRSTTSLKTDPNFLEETGQIMRGHSNGIDSVPREGHTEQRGWRASLRVKKV